MKHATAKLAKKNQQKSTSTKDNAHQVAECTALDRCYGQIGISAVAAAVRYQGAAKNPEYAPVPTHWHETSEAAA
jgi:hypothetical protein